VTPERAANLLFTEGYLWTELQFGIRRGSPPIRSEEDLRGKTISVNKGTPYEQWVTRNAERLDLKLLAFDTQPDAVQAVIQGRAQANLSGNTVVKYSASRAPQYVADYVIPAPGCTGARPSARTAAPCATRWRRHRVHEARRHGRAPVGALVRRRAQGGRRRARVLPRLRPAGACPGHDPTPHEPRCG
jgi:polar amino acid transport system substrate-binding protein